MSHRADDDDGIGGAIVFVLMGLGFAAIGVALLVWAGKLVGGIVMVLLGGGMTLLGAVFLVGRIRFLLEHLDR